MHIPDGFIDIPTAAATGAVALGVVAYSVRKAGREPGERTVPLLGITAAFIFAAQMLNFPVAGGTSGHFLGAALAVALLGPWGAVVVMTVVLVVQALGMADGGITALGANVLNMGVVATFVSLGCMLLLRRLLPRTLTGYLIALSVASWMSVVAASVFASSELAVSGTVPLGVALPAMVSVHMVIALGESLITVAVAGAVLAARPDLVASYNRAFYGEPASGRRAGAEGAGKRRAWSFVACALVVAAALALFIAPFASTSPDGLEKVATDEGFAGSAADEPAWSLAPFADYHMPGIADERVATAVAGLVGTLALFALIIVAGRVIGRRRSPAGPAAACPEEPTSSEG